MEILCNQMNDMDRFLPHSLNEILGCGGAHEETQTVIHQLKR
jgi:hypothetical protein